MSQEKYDITKEELDEIVKVGILPFQGKCLCSIHDKKPSFCKQGPLEHLRMPGCGYYFVQEDYKTVRKGECKNCGACCAHPRKNGSEYGQYHPLGSKCRWLKVEE